MKDKEYEDYRKTEKWAQICAKRRAIDKGCCVACGSRGSMNNPIEVHHLSYNHLGHEENRIYEDLCCLCRSCHKLTHHMMERVTSPSGRRGWKDNPRIPKTYTFTTTGEDRKLVIGTKKEEEPKEETKGEGGKE